MKNNWKKLIPACILGNILELYEFIIYGYFAAIIGKQFFPFQDHYSSLIATFAVFSTGCLIRPFSAVILGYLGDKSGRKISLIISIGIMAISTMGIGLLPTYSQIGIIASVLLGILRVFQGFSLTSEEIGASLLLMENAPENQRGFATSFVLGSVYIGLFLGSFISAIFFSILHEPNLSTWGWRIPFLLGGIMGLIILIIRIKQPESNEFRQAITNNDLVENPLTELFKYNKTHILCKTFICSSFAVAIYLFSVYIPNTVNIIHNLKYQTLLICSLGCLIAFTVSISIGNLIDKTGSKPLTLISSLGFFLFSYPIFYLLSYQSITAVLFAYIFFAILLGMNAGTVMFAIIKSFPVNIRFSASCISFNLSMSLFGGTAPLLALYLTRLTNNNLAPAFLLITTALMTLTALFFENKIMDK